MLPNQPTLSTARRISGQRGSMLLTAMLFAIGMALVLSSYISLSRTLLKVSHRTFFSNDAANLAEAGVEEALYSLNLMAAGTATATAWSGWTFSGVNATRTLSPFNRDQNAVGVVKVYVRGYDGSMDAPYIMSQAVVTPFDGGAPVIRTVQLELRATPGTEGKGLVALSGLTFSNAVNADSYISNSSGSPTGPWVPYSAGITRSNASTVVLAGTVTIGTGKVKGNLYLGSAVTTPAASKYTGTVTKPFTDTYPSPTFPTAAGVSVSYNLASTIPATLPRAGDLPAADGRYYYFCTNTTVKNVTISANSNVTIVGTTTNMTSPVTLPATSTLHVFMDKELTLTGAGINAAGWPGALRIYTTTATACTIGNNSQLAAWFHAPNSALTATGASTANLLSGYFVVKTISLASQQHFHFDESLPSATTYDMVRWMDFQTAADRATVAGLTGNFLR